MSAITVCCPKCGEPCVEIIDTAEAAHRLGISRRRLSRLIADGWLKAERFGRDYLIFASDLEAVRERPYGYPAGRPRRPRKQQVT